MQSQLVCKDISFLLDKFGVFFHPLVDCVDVGSLLDEVRINILQFLTSNLVLLLGDHGYDLFNMFVLSR